MNTFIEIKTQQGDSMYVDSVGAKLMLSLAGKSVLGAFLRGDGKNGVTHPCTPIFGPDRKGLYGLKQHGNMRNERCAVSQVNDAIQVLHEITDEGYPSGMKVEQQVQIIDGIFYFEMTHNNIGETPAAVNAGEHCYFDAPQGFAGTIVNGQDITSLIRDNYDGTAIPLQETNSIKIPGKPEYILKQEGLNKAVVWVGKNPQTKTIDQTYVCIEPVEEDPFGDFFGSPASILPAGQSRKIRFSIASIK